MLTIRLIGIGAAIAILLVAAGNSGQVGLSQGQPVRTLGDGGGFVLSVAFSPDGRLLASGGCQGGYVNDRLQLWDVSSGQRLRLFQGHIQCVNSVAFSPDGRLLASGSDDNTIQLWDISDLVGR
jgi:WD40 repeat protein